MFTGLIQSLGTVLSNEANSSGRRLVVAPSPGFPVSELGASIAVQGCCLTLVAASASAICFDVISQTLALTTLADLRPGAVVHLEPSANATTLLGGHFVLGHIDGVAVVRAIVNSSGEYRVSLAGLDAVATAIIPQGSITLDGVSLTIAKVHERTSDALVFDVCLIPETLARTRLRDWVVGTRVNLEADYLAKLVDKVLCARASLSAPARME